VLFHRYISKSSNMSSTSFPSATELKAISAMIQDLYVTRYVTIAGIVVLLYDLILCFPVELKLIWRSQLTPPKLWYIVYRYSAFLFLFFLMNDVIASRNLSGEWCAWTSIVVGVLIYIADAIGHGLIIYRIFILWNRDKRILRLMLLGSSVVNSVSFAFIILTVRTFADKPMFVASINACTISIKPKLLIGVWVPQILFDVYVLFLVLWNAMDRPRHANENLSEMLRRDGVFFVMATWALRIQNLILCSVGSPVLGFLGISFTESLITTINSRLLLKIFKAEHPREQQLVTLEDEHDDDMSMITLNVLRHSQQ